MSRTRYNAIVSKRADADPWITAVVAGLPQSHVLMCLLASQIDVESPEVALQLGTAVLHDIPIVVLAGQSVEVPIAVRQIAVSVERFEPRDPNTYQAAMERLCRSLERATQ